MQLSRNQFEILDHTLNRASCGLFCGDSNNMQELVRLGLMAYAGRKSFVPDPYFAITHAGRATWEEQRPKPGPIPRRKLRSRDRYSRFLSSDSGLTFGEFLKMGMAGT